MSNATRPKLTPKRDKFVDEYLLDLNGTQAAIRAGYSVKTANPTAARLLANVSVQEALVERRQIIAAGLEITPEKIIAEYAKIAFANMGTYVVWGPQGATMRESGDLSGDQQAAVAEVTEISGEKSTTVRFKLHDKLKALDSLVKVLGIEPPTRIEADVRVHDDTDPKQRLYNTVLAIASRSATDGGSSVPVN